MTFLRNLQLAFTRQVIKTEKLSESPLQKIIHENGIPSSRRLQVYQNNILSSLTESLLAVYPITERLVGKEFFEYAAEQYILLHPSREGDLQSYGEKFSDFLANFQHAQSVPYLSEVAQLEWGYHEVFHAAFHDIMDVSLLQKVPEDKYEEIRFNLHPASRLFAFQFPVSYICKICTNESEPDAEIVLPDHNEKILLIRRQLDIEMKILSETEFVFLSCFQEGKNLADACETVLNIEADFDVQKTLQQNILSGIIVSFS